MAEKTEKLSHPVENKAHAPHSADDWEILFEDPENGLLAMIEQTPSMDALERCANFALTKLLVHADESARLSDYEQQLAVIVGSDAGDRDIKRARVEVTALLRQLKEDSIRATEQQRDTPQTPKRRKPAGKKATTGRARRNASGQKRRTRPTRGWQIARFNKFGIIITSALALAAVAILAFSLQSPELPARERKAVIALLRAYGETIRPDQSWKIEGSRLTADDKFELVFGLTSERHLFLLHSLSPMKLAKFATRFCPTEGELLEKISRYERPIRIKIKEGRKVLTSASCPI